MVKLSRQLRESRLIKGIVQLSANDVTEITFARRSHVHQLLALDFTLNLSLKACLRAPTKYLRWCQLSVETLDEGSGMPQIFV